MEGGGGGSGWRGGVRSRVRPIRKK
jgi:hypothetical protein